MLSLFALGLQWTFLLQVQAKMVTGQLIDPIRAAPSAETLPWQLMVAERARIFQSALLPLQVTALLDRLRNNICRGAQVVILEYKSPPAPMSWSPNIFPLRIYHHMCSSNELNSILQP